MLASEAGQLNKNRSGSSPAEASSSIERSERFSSSERRAQSPERFSPGARQGASSGATGQGARRPRRKPFAGLPCRRPSAQDRALRRGPVKRRGPGAQSPERFSRQARAEPGVKTVQGMPSAGGSREPIPRTVFAQGAPGARLKRAPSKARPTQNENRSGSWSAPLPERRLAQARVIRRAPFTREPERRAEILHP